MCIKRVSVALNTSVLCFKRVTRPTTSCEKQVVQSLPDLALLVFCRSFHKYRAVPKILGCVYYSHREVGGDVTRSMPHTAGLTWKPHQCKLPHFTLSKGAKKDSSDIWENYFHGSIKQS